MILGLSFVVYWQFKSFQQSLTEVNLPKFKMPEIDSGLWPEGKEGYKEWISPDEKLKIKYPAFWLEMEEGSIKNYLGSTEKGEILLFAYRLELKNPTAMSFLVVQKLNLEKNLGKAIKEIENDTTEKGGEIKNINLKIKENQAEFETEGKSKTGEIFYSKERLILGGENLYLISVFSPEKNWAKIEKEANEILDSVELIPEMIK